ncbi:hypothetical protein E4U54_000718 [Claviceps lovelessii]|nr:hypothetical protein E4U54_000718 [Claviceps lovelessii]
MRIMGQKEPELGSLEAQKSRTRDRINKIRDGSRLPTPDSRATERTLGLAYKNSMIPLLHKLWRAIPFRSNSLARPRQSNGKPKKPET